MVDGVDTIILPLKRVLTERELEVDGWVVGGVGRDSPRSTGTLKNDDQLSNEPKISTHN